MNIKYYGIFFIILTLILSGCAQTTVPEKIIKNHKNIQDFLTLYPNSELRVIIVTADQVKVRKDFVLAQCNNPIPVTDYWLATVEDIAKDLKLSVWIEKETNEQVCVHTIGEENNQEIVIITENNAGDTLLEEKRVNSTSDAELRSNETIDSQTATTTSAQSQITTNTNIPQTATTTSAQSQITTNTNIPQTTYTKIIDLDEGDEEGAYTSIEYGSGVILSDEDIRYEDGQIYLTVETDIYSDAQISVINYQPAPEEIVEEITNTTESS